MNNGVMETTLPTLSGRLDEVFSFVLVKRGIVSKEDLETIEDRPLGTFLVETGAITPEQADEVLRDVSQKTLACDKCREIYFGIQPAEGKKYQCRKCRSMMSFPQEFTLEARKISFAVPPKPKAVPKAAAKSAAPAAETDVNWFFGIDGEKSGPHATDEIAGLVAEGKVTAETQAWRKGMKSWQSAGEIAELASVLEEAASPVPVDEEEPPPVVEEEDAPPPPPAASKKIVVSAKGAKAKATDVEVSEEPPPAEEEAPEVPPVEEVSEPVSEEVFQEGKKSAIWSYTFLPAGWWMNRKTQNSFAKYHVKQGFVFFIANILFGVAFGLLTTVLSPIIVGALTFLAGIYSLLLTGISLVYVGICIYIVTQGILNVVDHKQVPLPFLSRVPLLGLIIRKIGNPS